MFSFISLRILKFSFVVLQDKHMANFNTVSKTMLLTRKWCCSCLLITLNSLITIILTECLNINTIWRCQSASTGATEENQGSGDLTESSLPIAVKLCSHHLRIFPQLHATPNQQQKAIMQFMGKCFEQCNYLTNTEQCSLASCPSS